MWSSGCDRDINGSSDSDFTADFFIWTQDSEVISVKGSVTETSVLESEPHMFQTAATTHRFIQKFKPHFGPLQNRY